MRRADRGVVLGLYRSGPDRELLDCALTLGVRGIDTAYSYPGFTSHRALAQVAPDLLSRFTVSTKVGFFPDTRPHAGTVHSLDPARLRQAVERSADELSRAPDVVFLHNPERSLTGLPAEEGHVRLSAACAVLAEAVAAGWCRSWGLATWDARPLLSALRGAALPVRPDTVLMRAGLTVTERVLGAAEELCALLGVPPAQRWGMSPFAGSTHNEVWRTVNLGAFLASGQRASTVQAAFRVAYELPPVTRLAVGTSTPEHLRQLVAATELTINETAIVRYRKLISGTD